MRVRFTIVVNPAAGGGNAGRRWPAIEAALRAAGIDGRARHTARPGDARRLAREACGDADRLLAVGGDGTVNEVVNGLMDARADGLSPPPFGVIPATTGNDFARSIAMPLTLSGAIRALTTSTPGPLDLGRVEHCVDGQAQARYFALACHTGLAAEIGERANHAPKRLLGPLIYPALLVQQVFDYRPARVTAKLEGLSTWESNGLAVVVANGERLGGGMRMAPGARVDDGWLDFVGFPNFPLIQRLRYLPRIFPGTHISVPGVHYAPVRTVDLTSDPPTLLNVDGETIGRLPARVSIVPAALQVLCPIEAATD